MQATRFVVIKASLRNLGQQERQAEQHDLINVPFERLQLADVEERTPFGLRNSPEQPKTTSGLCKSLSFVLFKPANVPHQ